MSKCVVACSGGPDSMALLDQLNKKGMDLVVAHVNYQHRDTAFRDEQIVKEYCQLHNIPVRVLYPVYTSGNFQAWARDVRYDFFEDVAHQYHANTVYVAHQMDDVIETYIFQKERNMVCDWYGLRPSSMRHGLEIKRPLLAYTKKELEEYCQSHSVKFGIDESNLTNHYTRNVIRHTTIEKLTRKEKEEYIKKINLENEKLVKKHKEMQAFFESWNQDADQLLSQNEAWLYLDQYLFMHIKHHFSKKYLIQLCSQLTKNVCIEIENFYLERHNGLLNMVVKPDIKEYVLQDLTCKDYGEFSISTKGVTIESFSVTQKDFPLIVRHVKDFDSIQMRFGKKNVHRFFVDRKISRIQRKYWLVIENKDGDVIFAPGLGCDVNHYSKNERFYFKMHGLA